MRIGGAFLDIVSTLSGQTLGRLSSDISGTIDVGNDGSYSVDAVAVITKTGDYSWKPDSDATIGSFNIGNVGIAIGGNRVNFYDKGPVGPAGPMPENRSPTLYRNGDPVTVNITRDYYFVAKGVVK